MVKLLSGLNRLVIFVCIAGFFLASCASMENRKAKAKQKDLEKAVETFNSAMRWGDYQSAAVFVPASSEKYFWEIADSLRRSIRITEIKIRSIKTTGTSASVYVFCTYYRLDDPHFNDKILHQEWQLNPETNRWQVVDSELDRILP